MALPVTIHANASVGAASRNSYFGPFKSSGGNFYTIVTGLISVTPSWDELAAFKAIDPTSSFTEQDTADRPTNPETTAPCRSINTYQDSDDLHSAVQSSVNDVWYARFSMSSDAWADIDGAGAEAVLIDGAPDGLAQATDIAVLSAAYGAGGAFVKIRVVYQGQTDMDMGGEYERVDEMNSVDDGVTWNGPNQIDNGVGNPGRHFTGPRIVKHPSDDQCFIFMTDGVNLGERAIAGDDTLRGRHWDISAPTFAIYPFSHGIGITRSTVDKIRIGYREVTTNDLEVLKFDAFTDDTNPTITSDNVSTDDVQVDNSSVNACLAADGETIRGLMVKATGDDLFEFYDDDADSYTLEGTAHRAGTFNHISCNRFDRSGTKLAMIYDDGGAVKYDEIDLGGAGLSPAEIITLLNRDKISPIRQM